MMLEEQNAIRNQLQKPPPPHTHTHTHTHTQNPFVVDPAPFSAKHIHMDNPNHIIMFYDTKILSVESKLFERGVKDLWSHHLTGTEEDTTYNLSGITL